MKRCPNCNRTFEEDWLAFCTQDGTTLIDESPAKKDDLQATILAPAPPPPYAVGPKQGLAVASMICGLFSITFGWCCYLGTLSAPVALGLGIYQLVQIKNKPDEAGGKPFAIVGVVTGSLYFLGVIVIILIYGAAIMMGGIK